MNDLCDSSENSTLALVVKHIFG